MCKQRLQLVQHANLSLTMLPAGCVNANNGDYITAPQQASNF